MRWSCWVASIWVGVACAGATACLAQPFASVQDGGTPAGFLARLLINENPFPGERGFISVADSKQGMLSVLHVLDSRVAHIPAGYQQSHIAGVRATNVIDVIIAPNQCEGFSRGPNGKPTYAARVDERLTYLLKIANSGGKPGKFAELLNYGQGLAQAYLRGGIEEADRFAALTEIQAVRVTGRAYSWMTDMDCYHPGGNFVKIPDSLGGAPGGNRYFTLRKEPR